MVWRREGERDGKKEAVENEKRDQMKLTLFFVKNKSHKGFRHTREAEREKMIFFSPTHNS